MLETKQTLISKVIDGNRITIPANIRITNEIAIGDQVAWENNIQKYYDYSKRQFNLPNRSILLIFE